MKMNTIDLTANLSATSEVDSRMGRLLGLGTSMVGASSQGLRPPTKPLGTDPRQKLRVADMLVKSDRGETC